jgi:hypothetical protein
MPTIDLTDEEHTALVALIRRSTFAAMLSLASAAYASASEFDESSDGGTEAHELIISGLPSSTSVSLSAFISPSS